MTDSHTPTVPHRSSPLLLLFVGLFLSGFAAPASAQSVASVVDNMQARYEQQLERVDTYVVKTNLYTSYNEKVMKEGEPTYRTQTKMSGEEGTSVASNSTPSTAPGLPFDRLKKHATYAGTEAVDGARCHVLQVDEPSKVNPEMKRQEAESMTYYIDAEQHVPARMVMRAKSRGKTQGGVQASTVTIDMKNHKTVDGLTLPHRMEIQVEMDMSEQQRKQMKMIMQKMKNMPEQQRRQMRKRMGDRMDMMKQMISEEPLIVEVQGVEVNTEIPENVF